MLEEIYQALWRPYSALQFAKRSLSRAAENSLEKMAAVKLVKSYTDIKSYFYKSYFKIYLLIFYFCCFVFSNKRNIYKVEKGKEKKIKGH